jgi:ureidoglycolate lyase
VKLARFQSGRGPRAALVSEGKVIPIPERHGDLPEIIGNWPTLQEPLVALAQAEEGAIALTEVSLLAPIARPGKILAIGLNYSDHVSESGLPPPTEQVWFSKHQNTVRAPYATVQIPEVSSCVDYEAELVVVIGQGGRHIPKSDAMKHVFGYCVGNDVSVRDWQLATSQWTLGKSFDTHGPFGPWITTADEIGDPHRLDICCYVNGELRQRSNTKHLIYNVWDQISHLSQAMTLEAGDLLYTGTPGGVGWAMDPKRVLKAGDLVRCEVQELGHIENTCAREARGE